MSHSYLKGIKLKKRKIHEEIEKKVLCSHYSEYYRLSLAPRT